MVEASTRPSLLKKEQPHEIFYKERKPFSDGTVFATSRPPNAGDVPTGDEHTDFMLRSNLPAKLPANPEVHDTEYFDVLSPSEKAETRKIYHEKVKLFAHQTEINNGDGNLGNFNIDQPSSLRDCKTLSGE